MSGPHRSRRLAGRVGARRRSGRFARGRGCQPLLDLAGRSSVGPGSGLRILWFCAGGSVSRSLARPEAPGPCDPCRDPGRGVTRVSGDGPRDAQLVSTCRVVVRDQDARPCGAIEGNAPTPAATAQEARLDRANRENEDVQTEDLEYVGFWPRVGAALIDTLLLLCITVPLVTSIYGRQYWSSTDWIHGPADFLINWLLPAVAVVLFWVYRQATPGKIADRGAHRGCPNRRHAWHRATGGPLPRLLRLHHSVHARDPLGGLRSAQARVARQARRHGRGPYPASRSRAGAVCRRCGRSQPRRVAWRRLEALIHTLHLSCEPVRGLPRGVS